MVVRLTAEGVESFDSTKPAAIFPSRVKISLDERNEPFRLVIKNVSDKPINPALIYAPTEDVSVEVPEGEISPGDERAIFVTLNDAFDQASKKTSFTLSMMDYQDTRYTVPIEIGDVSPKRNKATNPPKPSTTPSASKTPLRPTGSGNKGGS